jgi:PTS system nitrogen regulatory IIA component
MQLDTILSPARTLCGAPGNSKKRVIENVAQFISQDISSITVDDLYNSLIARERLGSTGLGQGIAIPHCRLPNCQQIIGSLITLQQGVDFDAIDGQPVDVLFVLLVPEEAHDEHLAVLAALAQRFSDPAYGQALREASSNQSLFEAACVER